MIEAQLATQPDCENFRDFHQYYRSQYFGMAIPGVVGTCSCAMVGQDTERGYTVKVFNGTVVENKSFNWEEIVTWGRFGSPLLGTVAIGPTYAYYKGYALRESIKGLAPSKIHSYIPNSAVLDKYIKSKPSRKLVESMNRRSFATLGELETAHNVFNKAHVTWEDGIRTLERGEKIGVILNTYSGLYLDDVSPDISFSYKDYPGPVGKLSASRRDGYRIELAHSYKRLIPAIQNMFPNNVLVR